jgi:hypothetical protein
MNMLLTASAGLALLGLGATDAGAQQPTSPFGSRITLPPTLFPSGSFGSGLRVRAAGVGSAVRGRAI